ncbi:acyl-CoA dehydrogenase [Kineosporia sp. NBRC 101677]|uniref:acyl-CoA dehydrogenase family protein n=1 Tax=Kineosporia sp. NBRC 101677 TaxID=3032197 RepID=UPI0024A28F51|nr:acyl-CoA dehydrogenase family protein [Kineosporia sp. NBRC 101677]GLY14153.1 acyl-CoA dehydrogenase [Kineosporia sp. NBRC 101677]
MIEILSANAAQTEKQGRPAAPSLEAVRNAGDFALRMPVKHGGTWADATTTVRRLAELGRACPSTSWNVGTSAVAKTLVVTSLGDDLPPAFAADPHAQACGTGVPSGRVERGPDGTRVSGSWKSLSGCEDSVWAAVGVMDGDRFSLALLPVSDLKIEHTWDVAGMRGTGSHTAVAEGVVVPDEWVFPVSLPGPQADFTFYGLTALAPVVGATRGALDLIDGMFASDRKPYMSTYTRMAESPGARHWLGEATRTTLRAERALLALAAEVDSGDLTPADGPRISAEMSAAGRDCRQALELMLDLHGTSGFATSNALQRFWRDVAVGSRHPHLNPYLAAERFGDDRAAS